MTDRDMGEPIKGPASPVSHQPSAVPESRRGTPVSVVMPTGYGNIYTPHAGSMIIQVQREGGLQSRTFVLTRRQVRMLRFVTSRSGKMLLTAAAAIATVVTIQAARVPTLTNRISHMQHTAERLDTLEHSLASLQKRYDQVRAMMGADTAAPATVSAAAAAAGLLPGMHPSSVANDSIPLSPNAAGATGVTPRRRRRRQPPQPVPAVVEDTAAPKDTGATPAAEAEPQ